MVSMDIHTSAKAITQPQGYHARGQLEGDTCRFQPGFPLDALRTDGPADVLKQHGSCTSSTQAATHWLVLIVNAHEC